MKKKICLIIGGIILFILFLQVIPQREFVLQYYNSEGDLETEIFHSPSDFNNFADSLKEGIKYYTSVN